MDTSVRIRRVREVMPRVGYREAKVLSLPGATFTGVPDASHHPVKYVPPTPGLEFRRDV